MSEKEMKSEEKKKKSDKMWKTFKYAYVISVFLLGFGIFILKLASPDFDNWLTDAEDKVVQFFQENNPIYIILVIILITICKGVGVKDILSLRTISVVILSWIIVPNNKFGTFCIATLIMGVLSSCSKLLEYRAIGKELQYVLGTPVKFIFKYIRLVLLKCFDKEAIKWVDPAWALEISEKSREDPDMDVYSNFSLVITNLLNRTANDPDSEDEKVQGRHVTEAEINMAESQWNLYEKVCNAFIFVLAVIWSSVIEWVQPITELFLYTHNWRLSVRNVIIIVLSEIADFDKMLEVKLIMDSLYRDGTVIAGKIEGVFWKPLFWALGYIFVMPLTLLWAYRYHQNHLGTDSAGEDTEMVAPALDSADSDNNS